MDNIRPEYNLPQSDYMDGDKFKNRFHALSTDIQKYIDVSDLSKKVELNNVMLACAIVDYFEDIERLKVFHNVSHVNSIKIISYTAYWLLKRKPIQVIEENKDLMYVNERFVLAYILDYISGDKGNMLIRENAGLKAFNESLFYYFKYRKITPHSIEMILMAFFAGRIYQESNYDLSSDLTNKYKENL